MPLDKRQVIRRSPAFRSDNPAHRSRSASLRAPGPFDALHLFTVEDRPETKSRVLDPVKDLKTAMEELELEYINHAYEKYGNVREAAESLGMTPSTFVRKRQKYTKDAD